MDRLNSSKCGPKRARISEVGLVVKYDETPDIPGDLWAFLQYCEGGKLYRFLQNKAGLSHLTKQDFKSEYFFESFYGRNYRTQKVWRVIKEEFPTVADYISWSKRKGQLFEKKKDKKTGKVKKVDRSHAMLPRKAQEVEADFIIDRCCVASRRSIRTFSWRRSMTAS